MNFLVLQVFFSSQISLSGDAYFSDGHGQYVCVCVCVCMLQGVFSVCCLLFCLRVYVSERLCDNCSGGG